MESINHFLRIIGIPLNIFNIIVGLFIGIAYVYIPLTSMLGLCLGIIMALSGAVTLGISYFFTTKNVTVKQPVQAQQIAEAAIPAKNNALSNAFLCLALPCLLINSASSFFGMYTGTILLASALTLPVSPVGIVVAAIVLASVFTAGTLINSWLQTYNIWDGLRKRAAENTVSENKSCCEVGTQTDSYLYREKEVIIYKNSPAPRFSSERTKEDYAEKEPVLRAANYSPSNTELQTFTIFNRNAVNEHFMNDAKSTSLIPVKLK